MTLTPAELDRYCERIGFGGSLDCDLHTLQQLHQLHPLSIPFENLDSWLGRPVALEPAAIFEKLVTRQRGGYCFEHNLLFNAVLATLGFDVRGLAARVVWGMPPGFHLPRTHMLLLVSLDQERFIADVGFGGMTMTAPLVLDSNGPQQTPHEAFAIVKEPEYFEMQANVAGAWQPLYRFSLEAQMPSDYAMANWYVGTHPQSRFVQQLIAGRAAPGMRHALLDGRYTRHYPNRSSEQRLLTNPDELRAVLQQELAIDLSGLQGLEARLAALFPAPFHPETEP